ncbi:MAG: GNAT family N-acetyltransferase [Marinovum algicola]|jgi:ribosomal protein S18 acetylase RimI-like enzyme|uniref:Acetyltransferase (GNAT) family protein n=1 Tax=Marinovum algicola TaxID=42444 RepID=A0A975W7C1_9RHOB|nr:MULTISPECIES: GNAT family N-acetyltransferase [Marinovum]MDD9739032.1 GNAT family N-acetyltransferase [Marinovum sp. SP66]MDD9744186.1 GNAT family N-acetyltransferase [Marinovum sp. PR37]SEI82252.1 Acetyltransferase (GNAT) family protein [Marinovum algicola]SLN16023.1 putative acetyltransferase [Marinovum algicola]
MSTRLHLAGPDDIERLMPLTAAFCAETGLETDDDRRRAAVLPLLEGSPHGAVYLIGPQKAPVGYIILSFGWSLEFGGMDGFVDELYIRPAVRGRGMATDVLYSLPRALRDAGLKALHLEVKREDKSAQRLYRKAHFELRDGYSLMSLKL